MKVTNQIINKTIWDGVSIMYDKNYEYFKSHLENLLKDYNEKYIVIKDERVIGAYGSFDEAYEETIKTERLGSFIIQHSTKDALSPSANFAWNNVTFALNS